MVGIPTVILAAGVPLPGFRHRPGASLAPGSWSGDSVSARPRRGAEAVAASPWRFFSFSISLTAAPMRNEAQFRQDLPSTSRIETTGSHVHTVR
jgi:hypothetical protein